MSVYIIMMVECRIGSGSRNAVDHNGGHVPPEIWNDPQIWSPSPHLRQSPSNSLPNFGQVGCLNLMQRYSIARHKRIYLSFTSYFIHGVLHKEQSHLKALMYPKFCIGFKIRKSRSEQLLLSGSGHSK